MKLHSLFVGIGEPTRLGILQSLATGNQSVTDIAKYLNTEIVNVSHHLGVMKNAGIVVVARVGRFQMYSLAPEYWTTTETAIVFKSPECTLELTREKK